MVDAVVSAVLRNLGSYFIQEASTEFSVNDDVKWVQVELRKWLCFLKDADSKCKKGNEEVKNWIRDIRDAACDAEDVIETFILDADNLPSLESFKQMISNCPVQCLMQTIGSCNPIFTSLMSRYKVGKEIKKLKARINEISQRRAQLGIVRLDATGGFGSTSLDESLQARRRGSPHYDDPNVVGFQKDKEDLIGQLLNDEKRRCVISIVGMGGLGKTTLAKKVFHSDEVQAEFNICAWITVSQDYNVLELLKKVLEKVAGGKFHEKLDEEELKEQLYGTLMSKGRYLIVMDDVWEKDVWDRIKTALPDAGKGSRVLFTTRHHDVAKAADPVITPYLLPFLNEEESRKLFLKMVYPNGNRETFPEDLQVVGQNLVDRCHGLPLALMVLGGFLSIKEKSSQQWSRVLKNLNWESTEVAACLAILRFSYEGLSYDLKPCFLYLSAFPEDSEISAKKLMRLWMSEGFIPQRLGERRDVMAEDFLEELVQRSMVQVSGRKLDGSIHSIRIHDLLRDLCIEEARESGFLHVGSSHAADNQQVSTNIVMTRRLAAHGVNLDEYIDSSSKKWRTPKLRTLLGGSQSLEGLKFLRVLEVEAVNDLPKEIASMIHLRHLRYRGELSVQYEDIKKLHNLQLLDVTPTIWNTDVSIGDFKDLQHLSTVVAGIWIEGRLAKLINLQKLTIERLEDSHSQGLIRSLKELHHLGSLTLYADESIPSKVLSIFPQQHPLRSLKLIGRLSGNQQAPAIGSFQNLIKLKLSGSGFEQDPMPALKELPSLMSLQLSSSAYVGSSMNIYADGFTQLRSLSFYRLPMLADWTVESGAFPKLTRLHICRCYNLMMLPEGLQFVTSLQELSLLKMSHHLIQRLRWDDWHKIKHIPSIYPPL